MSEHTFLRRHIGPDEADQKSICQSLGVASLDELMAQVIPEEIRLKKEPSFAAAASEHEALASLQQIMGKNRVHRSLLGQGFYDTVTPSVILRTIFENPGWYTAYTPYQAEISQGRLEALLNFQTMITSITGLDIANASLLDEGSACAEAMSLCRVEGKNTFLVSPHLHRHALDVVRTRAEPLGIQVVVEDVANSSLLTSEDLFAVLVQYPDNRGLAEDFTALATQLHDRGARLIVNADLLSLLLLRSPGEMGADVCIGNSQRFGVPMGFGGPHAAFMSVKDELKRKMPGRLIGVSKDVHGRPAYRLSLQTREQHIRREKATSNICTAQVLLAVMASMYAVYHGPDGLRALAERIHRQAEFVVAQLQKKEWNVTSGCRFDTIHLTTEKAVTLVKRAKEKGLLLHLVDASHLSFSLDEKTNSSEIQTLLSLFGVDLSETEIALGVSSQDLALGNLARTSSCLDHPVFRTHRSETEMMRYIRKLENRDIALNRSMIPLGSCTMKLNPASSMIPLSWAETAGLHPFVHESDCIGYHEMLMGLEAMLNEITGFVRTSLQPNAGSQGEYAGLLAIRRYHLSRGDDQRDICLIPVSAHGTNPASAHLAGMKVVAVPCDSDGNVRQDALSELAKKHENELAALMVTYPSTHGVYEEGIVDLCEIIHSHGGLVYMDGANMNAQAGLTSPARIGADVCHLNLHKTFCIPHGGGGPGVGPVCVNEKLAPFVPGHGTFHTSGAVASGPFGSASINVIPWMYLKMIGGEGVAQSTRVAILNANYLASLLEEFYPVLYKGRNGWVAHECILDLRHFKKVTVEDVAKRLMDYGFHAPTMSWPVGGTLMVEPTESESKEELDRFAEAMISIHREIMKVEAGDWPENDNPLKNAPHTAESLLSENWSHAYSREIAAYPLSWVKEDKYWPPVGRVDNVHGDRHLICTCPSVEEMAE